MSSPEDEIVIDDEDGNKDGNYPDGDDTSNQHESSEINSDFVNLDQSSLTSEESGYDAEKPDPFNFSIATPPGGQKSYGFDKKKGQLYLKTLGLSSGDSTDDAMQPVRRRKKVLTPRHPPHWMMDDSTDLSSIDHVSFCH